MIDILAVFSIKSLKLNLQLKRLVGLNVSFLLSNCANHSKVASCVLGMAILLNISIEGNEKTLLCLYAAFPSTKMIVLL